MKPARFDYVRAQSVAEAHETLAQDAGDARILAGGQTLMPMLSMRLARPKVLIDIMHLPELRRISDNGNAIRVGAAVRQDELLSRPDLARSLPLVAAALPFVGHAQTRSRGTICGSAAHADPSAEIPLALVALRGSIELSARRKTRSITAEDFFIGMMSTARGEDELIEAVTFPKARPGQGYAFREFGRRHGDFAIVGCAAVVSDRETRLAIGGVADRPVARDFRALDGTALDDALHAFAFDLDARDDLHATARYRRELVRRMGRAVIEEARRCLA
ncbi:FAD binding domain-containing protein [Pseudorhodoplanes sp.]|uniref:FAD binding domain-containing protein n=1 Tax=Pseudorhodoplanes sp. TaxID=1934341 RepID=UPI00391CD32B